MSNKAVARLWLGLGACALTALWGTVLFRPAWTEWAGFGFTSVPFVAAAIELWPRLRNDFWSAVAAMGLWVLFFMAWLS